MLPVVSEVADLYRTADGVAVACLVAKLALEKTYQAKLDETRNAIQASISQNLFLPSSALGCGEYKNVRRILRL